MGKYKSKELKEEFYEDEKFLDEVCKDGNVTRACEVLGITPRRLFRRRAIDAEFYDKMEQARQVGINAFIDECHRRAFYGVDEPVFHQGEICGYKKRYSDQLAMFLIKAWRPEYRDNFNLIGITDDSKFSLTINTGDANEIVVTPTKSSASLPPPQGGSNASIAQEAEPPSPPKKRPKPIKKRKAPPVKGRKPSDIGALLKGGKKQ